MENIAETTYQPTEIPLENFNIQINIQNLEQESQTLEEINNKIQQISNELKEINRPLPYSPDNLPPAPPFEEFLARKKKHEDYIQIDNSRDDLLTDFGKVTLTDRYLLPGETCQGMFRRVAASFADDEEHGQRLYDYFSKLWAMPSTPVLANSGTTRGQSISCFLNEVDDNIPSIVNNWRDNCYLAVNGGGIATNYSKVRSIGEKVGVGGKTSGVIPFIKVQDSISLGVNQGGNRSGSCAIYLDISHPEIEEFIEIRRNVGDMSRRSLNIHNAVCITDDFMKAVEDNLEFPLISPKTKEVIRYVNARKLFQQILENRIFTGEPYILYIDTINKAIAPHQKELGLRINTSNLCSEITLPTGVDHLGNNRCAVCCLSSLNLEYWEQWKDSKFIIEDMMRFLDNILEYFINYAPNEMNKARYAAYRERAIGLGVMGKFSLLQSKMIPLESIAAKTLNIKIFKHIKKEADRVSKQLAFERGSCPDAEEVGVQERFSYKLAVAPTASISIIAGDTSPGIEPIYACAYVHKTLSGSFFIKNKFLEKLLEEKGINNTSIWESVLTNEGSVQHLEQLTEKEKEVFKTAFELNQQYLIEHAADVTPYICQSQSLNLFLKGDTHKWDLMMLHYTSWRKGVKSLYYCRSKSVQRAAVIHESKLNKKAEEKKEEYVMNKYEECLSCT